MSFGGGPVSALPDGRVFVASSPDAEVYDPRSGTLAFAGVIPGGVTDATALPDGRVVIIGVTGLQSGGYVGMWDPTGQAYRQLYDGSHPLFAATLLDDGRVLVTGGRGTAWAGVLDPANEQMTPVSAPEATSTCLNTAPRRPRADRRGARNGPAHGPDLPVKSRTIGWPWTVLVACCLFLVGCSVTSRPPTGSVASMAPTLPASVSPTASGPP